MTKKQEPRRPTNRSKNVKVKIEPMELKRADDKPFHFSVDGRINVAVVLTMLITIIGFIVGIGSYMSNNENRMKASDAQIQLLVTQGKDRDLAINSLRDNTSRLSEILARMEERQNSTLEAVKEIKSKIDSERR